MYGYDFLKDPKEYAQEVKALDFTKEEFLKELIRTKMPSGYIIACLEAW